MLIQYAVQRRLRVSLEPEEADRIIEGIAQSLDFIKDLPPSLRMTVRDCYSRSIQTGFGLCLAFLVVSMISVFWWREKKLSR